MTIEEKYSKLKAKYNLPDFRELNNAFEISLIEKDEFFLREIRRKIADKIGFFSAIMAGAISPECSPGAVIEFGNIDDDDAKKAFDVYKKLMYWERCSAQNAAICDEKKDAEFIRELNEAWKTLKNDVAEILEKLKEAWKKKTAKENGAYLL